MQKLTWLQVLFAPIIFAAGSMPLLAQAPAVQAYDVVTVKVNQRGPGSTGVSIDDTYYKGENVNLADMMRWAFNIRAGLIEGIPKWAETTRYDLFAKVSDPDIKALKALKEPEQRAMFRAVLEDRFQLKVHRATKIMAVLDLVVDKSGSKLTAIPELPTTATDNDRAGRGSMRASNGDLTGSAVAIRNLTEFLEQELDKTVIDKTGLKGEYSFHLIFLPERRPELPDSPPRLLTAVQEQLGLKLEGDKGPVEVLVIDRAEMPSAN